MFYHYISDKLYFFICQIDIKFVKLTGNILHTITYLSYFFVNVVEMSEFPFNKKTSYPSPAIPGS